MCRLIDRKQAAVDCVIALSLGKDKEKMVVHLSVSHMICSSFEFELNFLIPSRERGPVITVIVGSGCPFVYYRFIRQPCANSIHCRCLLS